MAYALLGEAVEIKDPAFGADFPYHMKQRGMLLAKSRVLGIQFRTLFQGDLFSRLARHSNEIAAEMSTSLVDMGLTLWQPTDSNQVFVILPLTLVRDLQKNFDFVLWKDLGNGRQVVRFVTSWATEVSEVRGLCAAVVARLLVLKIMERMSAN